MTHAEFALAMRKDVLNSKIVKNTEEIRGLTSVSRFLAW